MRKTKILLALFFILVAIFACDENNKKRKIYEKELMFETEHCRYYCLQKNGWKACKISICECDSGFYGDISNSW